MKKTLVVLTLAAIMMIAQNSAFAQEPKEEKSMMMGEGKMHGGEMLCGGMMGMCPMHGMMMKQMMGRSIIATEDGGIVVIMGNKIAKYDKKLNLVNEVELKVDFEMMQKKMAKMMDECPMCGKMMGEGGMMRKMMMEKEETEGSEKPGHEKHH